jgi:hypothetical protein
VNQMCSTIGYWHQHERQIYNYQPQKHKTCGFSTTQLITQCELIMLIEQIINGPRTQETERCKAVKLARPKWNGAIAPYTQADLDPLKTIQTLFQWGTPPPRLPEIVGLRPP